MDCKIYWYNLPTKVKEIILFALDLEIDQDQEDALNELFATVQWFNLPASIKILAETMLSEEEGYVPSTGIWFNAIADLKSTCEQINEL